MNKNILSHRRTLLPYLANKIKAKNYLEVGVKGGRTFLPIKVRKKYAVDPDFRIKSPYKRQQIFKYPFNMFAQYFACTSDDFFANHAEPLLERNTLELAFLDGLHTYAQTYQDIENTLPYLSEKGLIVVHDCSPQSASSAFPANSIDEVKKINPPGFDGLWSGDVWKVIPRLKLEHPELTVFVIDHDSGIGIISKANIFTQDKISNEINYSVQDIHNLSYDDMVKNKVNLLNIISDQQLLKTCQLFL